MMIRLLRNNHALLVAAEPAISLYLVPLLTARLVCQIQSTVHGIYELTRVKIYAVTCMRS
jgi:hypothetical protein